MSKILRFVFKTQQDQDAVESDMALAIFTAECLHGRPRVRLETRYLISPGGGNCVMEVSGDAGEAAARVFAGLAAARFGEEAINIKHYEERQLEVLSNGA
jgi:hypothetical protein